MHEFGKDKKKKRGLRRNKFKMRKEHQEKEKKLTRLQRKKLKKELDSLKTLSERELQAYRMMKDPNNQFMRRLTLEGEEGFNNLRNQDMWASIAAKKLIADEHSPGDVNAFLNLLTMDEFSEFI